MASVSAMPSQPAVNRSSHPFTCNTCQVAFRSSEMQRAHMQTDWHRYNLKRRVASLPPLSSEVFTEKVLANKATQAATAAKASFEKLCSVCNKTYFSENAYTNHRNSSKHKANLSRAKNVPPSETGDDAASMLSSAFSLVSDAPSKKSEVDPEARDEFDKILDGIKNSTLEDGGDPLSRRPTRPHHSGAEQRPEHPISPDTAMSSTPSNASSAEEKSPLLHCLFCNYRSPTPPLNILHMNRHHGLFIPEQDYLVDQEGLLMHLFKKIHRDFACLYCNKQVHTATGIQTHMRDLGHCMINFDNQTDVLNIGQFYDFSSTWSDQDADSDDSDSTEAGNTGGVRLTTSSQDGEEAGEDGEDEGWETDSTLSSVPTDEITSVPIDDRSHRYKLLNRNRHHSHTDPRKHRNADGFHSHAHTTPHAVYYDDYELHLPSGRVAGHRSLNKYFRQNLRNYPTPAEREQRLLEAGSGEDADGDVEMADENTDGESVQNGNTSRTDPRSRAVVTRANGGLGMVGVTDSVKKEVAATEKRERRREQRHQNKVQAIKERKGNFQKHYRDPLLQ